MNPLASFYTIDVAALMVSPQPPRYGILCCHPTVIFLVLDTPMQMIFAWVKLGWHLCRSIPAEGARHMGKRLFLFLVFWLLAGVLTLLHTIGFALDEVLFRGYRKVRVKAPVFILGVPRSGTTLLQRMMARDQQFTTLTLWECVLAPSISERYFWTALGSLSRWLFKPFTGLSRRLRWSAMDSVHTLGWREPEEDFLLLFYRQACFLMTVVCPNVERYWRLADFDRAVPVAERAALMGFYYRCLQRHLYFHGSHHRLLSKNPSFTPMMESLRQTFPGACFIACVRDPMEAAPSQLSALRPALKILGNGALTAQSRDRFLAVLRHYFQLLQSFQFVNGSLTSKADAERHADTALIAMARLKQDLTGTLRQLYQFIDQPLPTDFEQRLQELSDKTRRYQSGHRYRPENFGLSEYDLRQSFAHVWPPHAAPEVKG